jgi:sulfite reductase (NADPH) flavoprotein alpha-component
MMQPTAPHIPPTAPFSPEQREWLNGFLAGLFSPAPQNVAAPAVASSLRVAVYVASQSGTAERLGKKLAKQLKAGGHTVELLPVEKLTPAALAQQQIALFAASTYGEGEPPDSARTFRDALFADGAPRLNDLRYSVFCLGDRHYEHFCRFGIELDQRLELLGATRISPRVESDVDVDDPFARWCGEVSNNLVKQHPQAQAVAAQSATTGQPDGRARRHTRENPFFATVRERRILTAGTSSKSTIHVSLAADESSIRYEAGDACGVIVQNDPALVYEILSLLPFAANTPVTLPKVGTVSLEQALQRHLQITRLSRKMVHTFAEHAQCGKLSALLTEEQATHLERFLHGRGLVDLVCEYPGAITSAEELVSMLPSLSPRLYSISSSPAAHSGQVHCTVGVVRYHAHDRERGGVASTMLADRVQLGEELPIYIQPNSKFRLPSDQGTPIIMIGPGTGIAPFRGFLHERRALGHKGRNWLFFGERNATSDFLYRDDLNEMTRDGVLTRLDTAFSRDQEQKLYVQDRMLQNGAELWKWLNDGALLYVCGDASRMAKDVDAALHTIVEQHGCMSSHTAQEFVAQLHEERRYRRDVY